MDELEKYYAAIQEPIGDDAQSLLHGMELHRGLIARVGQMLADAKYQLAVAVRDSRRMTRAQWPNMPENRVAAGVESDTVEQRHWLARCSELQRALSVGFKTLQSKLSYLKVEHSSFK